MVSVRYSKLSTTADHVRQIRGFFYPWYENSEINKLRYFIKNAKIFFFSEAKIINFFGKKSSKEFVVENYSMKISENAGKTTLKEICFTKICSNNCFEIDV